MNKDEKATPFSYHLYYCLGDSPSFLALDELHQAELRSFSVKWSGLSGRKPNLERASSDATRHIAPMPPRSILPPKLKAFDSWKSDYISNHHTHSSAPWISCPPPEDSTPPPFVQGALSLKLWRILSAAIQLTPRHGFHADYSDKFRPDAGMSPSARVAVHCYLSVTLHHRTRHLPLFSPQQTPV